MTGKYVCVVTRETSGEESITVVPLSWTKDGYAYWSDSLYAKRQFAECSGLDENWPSYKILKTLVQGGKRALEFKTSQISY